ncbi:MAG: DUF6288 domain-containing protein [Lentisphaeria bacterium]|nr:DUF6288 domain-containing protein [Lentisphaeria bacterium]
MNMRYLARRISIIMGLGVMAVMPVRADFYTRPALFTLRPSETGALSTVDRFGPVGIGIELRQPAFVMVVKNVEAGSPAAASGLLKTGQIIDSINGESLVGVDPRIQLGDIITKAEAKNGVIRLRVRDDENSEPKDVVVRIPALGSYSGTWPLDCGKSNRIVRGLADWVGKQQPAITTSGGLRLLFLLSTGEEQDLDVARQWVGRLAKQYADKDVSGAVNWHLGYGGIPLAEYYLRTGDASVLPVIRKVVKAAEANYMPGGWAQRGLGGLNYYAGGRMNPAGVHVMTFLLLARECGVEVDENVFQGGLKQYFRFAGRGVVAYGDHRPENGYTDNGRIGAFAFTMAAAAAQFPDTPDNVYAQARDASAVRGFYYTHRMLHGHTGGGIGEIWRGAAMGLARGKEPVKYQEFMNARRWFYELSRRHDGSFGILGGERYDNTEWGAGLGLAYTIPRRTLRVSGAPSSPHSHPVVLPERAWGTAADDDFYSLKPAVDTVGVSPDVAGERFADVTAAKIYTYAPDAAAAGAEALRSLLHHPDIEIRLMAAGQLNRHPALATELLRSPDARVRRAALEGVIRYHNELLTPENVGILLRMINDPEESWFVVDGSLQALKNVAPEVTLPHVDRLIYWLEHPEWWVSNSAMLILTRMAAQGHEVARITQAVGPVMAANQRYGRWSAWTMGPIIKEAKPAARQALLDMFAGVYTAWPVVSDAHPEPRHPEFEAHVTAGIATLMATMPGGLDKLYAISRERFPKQTLAHRDVFIKSDQIDANPAMRAALAPIIRDELIPQFVARNRRALERGQKLDELVGLYNRIGVHDYDWREHGPKRTEMEWDYFSFDPVEQPPLGRERNRLGRYREVSYPEGMENWYKPAFDAKAADWRRGKSPFASFDGKLKAAGGCAGGFCGCGEPPNTLWEKEVLLINGNFDIPAFEEGNLYRILIGGMSHVGAGDGCRVYVNGREIYARRTAVDRRAGGKPIGTHIGPAFWPEFARGTVNLAATSFLKYHPRTKEYGNYLTVFLQRMKLPPMGTDMLKKAAPLVPMRSAEWQTVQEPGTNVDPEDGTFKWDGVFVPNPAVVGSWQVVGQVESVDAFAPGAKPAPVRAPRFGSMTFTAEGGTADPLWIWSDGILMDLDQFQALRVEPRQMDGKDYLLIEAGGFDTKHGPDWTPPWLVLEREPEN